MSGATLVVGATGGIGRALTAQLLAAGQSVIAVARTPAALDALKLEHPDVEIESADAADFEALLDIAKRAQTRHGGVAGAVNLAGSLQLTPAHRTSQADWTHTITQNLTTAFALVRAAASVMLRSGGSIVLASSAAARLGLPNHDAIAAAKAGVIGLTRSAAATYAPRGIRVNAVAPGLIETPLTQSLTARPAHRKASTALHALGRLGRPDEVASAIAWLLNPDRAFVTGQVFGIDGGLSSVMPRRTT